MNDKNYLFKKIKTEPVIDTVNIDLHLFSFDEQRLDDLSTLKACIGMFYSFDLIDKFNIQYEVIKSFLISKLKLFFVILDIMQLFYDC